MSESVTVKRLGEDASGATIVDFDPFDEAALRDPFPYYDALREHGSVVKLAAHDCWAAFGFQEVTEILRDWKTYSSAAGIGLANYHKVEHWRTPSLVLETDPPEHDVPRRILTGLLLPKSLQSLQSEFERQAEIFVDRVVEMSTFDGVADLAAPYPLKVFPDAVGLPEEGREHLIPYATLTFNAVYEHNALYEDAKKAAEPSIPWISKMCAREAVDPQGLAEQVYRSTDSGAVTEDEAGLLVRSFLSAGIDTTATGIASALYAFARFPEQWDVLLRKPALVRPAIDEVLRWGGAVLHFFRTTTRDTEIDGVRIPAGEKVMICFAAANRDPKRWPDPARFDVERNAKRQVAFGLGVHACLGKSLAQLEIELVLKALAKRVKRFEFVGEPEIRLNNSLRGLATLPMRVIPFDEGDRSGLPDIEG